MCGSFAESTPGSLRFSPCGRFQAQKIFQEVGDKAAESVACVHLAQAG